MHASTPLVERVSRGIHAGPIPPRASRVGGHLSMIDSALLSRVNLVGLGLFIFL